MPYEIYMNIGNYQGKDFSNYEVSNLGNVRNANTKQVLKTRTRIRDNYSEVDVKLSDTNHKKHTITVARLVISTFKANSENKPTVNHINEDPSDNKLNNLEWATYSENNTHNGRAKRVAKKAAATMKANGIYTEIAEKNKIKVYCKEVNQTFDSAADAAIWLNKKYGAADITKCCKNKRETAYNYHWEYANDSEGDVK